MIGRIRGARINFKTGLIILALAAILWAVVVYVRIRDFVPEEYREPVPGPTRTL